MRTHLLLILANFCLASAIIAAEETGAARTGANATKQQVANEEPGVVTGEVVLADGGTPVAGARVLLRDNKLLEAVTDAEGRFRITGALSAQAPIWATTNDLVSRREQNVRRTASASSRQTYPPIRLLVGPGRELRITVISETSGEPLSATVAKLGYPDFQTFTAGKDGVILVSNLRPEKYEIELQAPGHARSRQTFDLLSLRASGKRQISLSPGGTLRGTVRDANGQPVAGASVHLLAAGSKTSYPAESPISDEKGAFFDRHLPLNTTFKLSIDSADYLSTSTQITSSDEERDVQVDVTLESRPRGGSVAGTVTNANGKPIDGATIVNFGRNHKEMRVTRSDPQGRFVLHDLFKLSGDPAEIFVSAEGHAPARRSVGMGTSDASAKGDVQLGPGHSLKAQVENSASKPIAGAIITAISQEIPVFRQMVARSDNEGRFEFASLPAKPVFRIRAEGYTSAVEKELALDGEHPAVIVLKAQRVLHGKVVDAESGKPLTRFVVTTGFDFNGRLDFPGRGINVQSDDGLFAIPVDNDRPTCPVRVEATGYEKVVARDIPAHEFELGDPVKIEIAKIDPAKLATLTGKILDPADRPLAGVQVRLIVSELVPNRMNANKFNWAQIDSGHLSQANYVDQYLAAVTDDKGGFRFAGLLPGRNLQLAYWGTKVPRGRYVGLAKTVSEVAQSTTINTVQPAVVRGTFDRAAFAEADGIQLLNASDRFAIDLATAENSKSEFRFENLPPGRYSIVINSRPKREPNAEGDAAFRVSRPLAQKILEVVEGETYDVEFTAEDKVK